MQLFTVELTVEIVVVADDESGARETARDLDYDAYDIRAAPMRHLPSSWELSSIPYGDGDPLDRDRTVRGWIAIGAAPGYPTKP